MSCEWACQTCASIRSATLQLVGERGLTGVNLDLLAEQTGLTRDELCEHYPSVEDCLSDTYEEVSMDLIAMLAESFARGKSWADGLVRGHARVLARLAHRPAEARLLFVEVLRGDRELLWRRESMRALMVQLLTSEHSARSEREDLPPMQHELLVGASFQLISSHVAEGQIDELPELAPELAELAGIFEPLAA